MFTAEELSVIKATAEYAFPLHARPPIVQHIIDKAHVARNNALANIEAEED